MDGIFIPFTLVTIAVDEVRRGPNSSTIDVRICGTETVRCTVHVPMTVGKRYLVFAYGPDFETNKCSPTTLIE